jgi:hypothetical protein
MPREILFESVRWWNAGWCEVTSAWEFDNLRHWPAEGRVDVEL